jgi:aspartyl-tRNA(Asn)/glutamyl-tRNA(Gln) amidotransferase subunit C
MVDEEKIRQQGIVLIEKFSKMLENIPQTEETHYVIDQKNVTRQDGEPIKKKDFQEKLKKNAPRWEEGYVVAEKAGE